MSKIAISFNGNQLTVASATSLASFISQQELQLPFAVAINTIFVAQGQYRQTILQDGDQIDIVQPVVGG